MKKMTFIIGLALVLTVSAPVFGAEKVAGQSSTMAAAGVNTDLISQTNDLLIKKTALRKVLNRYDSPMAESVNDFIKACMTYNLECYLLPSIAGLESTFGRFIYPNSYNPFGWGRGYIMFKNWGEAIDVVAYGLRKNYLNRGAQTTDQIGRIYSESPTWATRVDFLKKQFYNEEEKLRSLKPIF